MPATAIKSTNIPYLVRDSDPRYPRHWSEQLRQVDLCFHALFPALMSVDVETGRDGQQEDSQHGNILWVHEGMSKKERLGGEEQAGKKGDPGVDEQLYQEVKRDEWQARKSENIHNA